MNTWATQHYIPTRYILLNEEHFPPKNNRPYIIFFYRLYVGHSLYFDGQGSSHQRARTDCAYRALNFIQQNQMFNLTPTPTEVNCFHNHFSVQIYLLDSSEISSFTDV